MVLMKTLLLGLLFLGSLAAQTAETAAARVERFLDAIHTYRQRRTV